MPRTKGDVFNPVTRKYEQPAEGGAIQDPNPEIKKEDASATDAPAAVPHVGAQRVENPDENAKPKGIRIKLTETGAIDWEGMKISKTDAKLRATILADPKVKEFFVQRASTFSPEAAGSVLDALVKVEAVIARFTLKVDADICSQTFTYTKEQHAAMDPVAARVMAKYTPDWLAKYQDEIMLGSILLMVTREQFDNAIRLQAHRNKFGRAPEPPVVDLPAPVEPAPAFTAPAPFAPPVPESAPAEGVTFEDGFAVLP